VVRVQFARFQHGDETAFSFEGDVVITCLEGDFAVGDEATPAPPLTQIVATVGEHVKLRCVSEHGAIQIIWARSS
jgi:hypothetical protein